MQERVILLVEDNEDDELLTIRGLKDAQILNKVVVAHDGVEALDYLFGTGEYAGRDTTDMPQVVLLDLMLPRLNGLEVLRRIREDARTERLPVVILTSSREEEDVIRSYELGANSYVGKPVKFADFANAVKQLGLFWVLLNEGPPVRRAT
ncbi:MAG: response regulator [Polyangiaceae bacterium]|nr:response regulator [Polyangiaceae bacterium]